MKKSSARSCEANITWRLELYCITGGRGEEQRAMWGNVWVEFEASGGKKLWILSPHRRSHAHMKAQADCFWTFYEICAVQTKHQSKPPALFCSL